MYTMDSHSAVQDVGHRLDRHLHSQPNFQKLIVRWSVCCISGARLRQNPICSQIPEPPTMFDIRMPYPRGSMQHSVCLHLLRQFGVNTKYGYLFGSFTMRQTRSLHGRCSVLSMVEDVGEA